MSTLPSSLPTLSSSLAALSSAQLLAQLRDLVRRGNEVEAELLAHIGEVDARRLYLEQGCSSMFAYCQRVLHFADSVAYKRIASARAARCHPDLLLALRRGELHLSAVSLLAPKLTAKNAAELIRASRHRSAEEIRQLLADRAPRPGVPARVCRVSESMIPMVSGTHGAKGSSAPPDPNLRAGTEPLGAERYRVHFTADRALFEQMQELRALMRHQIPDGDLGEILARAVALLLERVRKRKFAETSAPRPRKRTRKQPSRHIPAAIRRAVWSRDGGRCTYVSAGGRRCGAREFLEFDHVEGWAHTREHPLEGITLRCRGHNQDRARREYGERHMARSCKRGDDVPAGTGERAPACRPDPADPTGYVSSPP